MNGPECVLKRVGDGKYVCKPGMAKNYSRNLRLAQVFPSREAAEKARCVESEVVVSLWSEFGHDD